MDSLFITTGYAGSGWDLALSACSLDTDASVDADQLSNWRDQMVAHSTCAQASELPSTVDPDASMLEGLDQWLSRQDHSQPLILADERDFWLLDVWAARCPQARFLLFYTDPETALIQALLRGDQPDDFLSGWRMAARHLIGFQRRHRRRALLLDADAARLDPQGMVEAVRGLGLDLSLFDRAPSAPPVELPLERLLVRRWLDMQPDLPLLQAELEAHALPLADRPPQPDPDPSLLVEHYLRERAQRSAERDLQERLIAEQDEGLVQARERLDELKASLAQARDESAALAADHQQRIEALTAEKATLVKDKAALTSARDEQVKLAAERQQRIEALNAEKTTLAKDKEALTSLRDEQARQVAEKNSELSRVRERLNMLEADQKDIKEENELLLLQLHQVQEELESQFLSAKEQEASLTQACDEQAKLAAERQQRIEALTAEKATLAKDKAALTSARDEQAKLTAERQQRIEALTAEKATLAKDKAALTSVRDEQTKLAAERQQRIEALTAEKATLAKDKAALTSARDEQARRVAEQESELSRVRERLSTLEADQKDVKEENELLLLQLNQVQEELEQYFLKYQTLVSESSDKAGSAPPEAAAVTPPAVATRRSVRRQRPPALKSSGLFAKNRKERKRLERYIAIIKESGLFDEEWYLRQYPDVAEAGFDPVEHYVCHGVADRRNPSSWFDTHFYMTRHPDVAGSIMNPLVHYQRFGQAENRETRPGWNG